jgi:hypothetical protein
VGRIYALKIIASAIGLLLAIRRPSIHPPVISAFAASSGLGEREVYQVPKGRSSQLVMPNSPPRKVSFSASAKAIVCPSKDWHPD